jgi:predicted MFS family arabinose efflux permease
MGAAVAGALLGPVLGGIASRTGTGAAFTFVAVASLVLAGWAWASPAPPPVDEPQPLRYLLRAFREREVVSGFWLVSLSAFLLGVVSVVAPIGLDELGWGAVGIGAAFLVSAAIEAALNPLLGTWSDRYGRFAPVRAGLFGCIGVSLVLPWVDLRWPAFLLVVAAGVFYGFFWVPGTALLSDGAETAGLDQGFGFALLNVAWAPANLVGAVLGGALADAFGDVAPYLLAAVLSLLTFVAARPGLLDRRPVPAKGSA